MGGFACRSLMHRFSGNPLWSDRERWGLIVDGDAQHWLKWQKTYTQFYLSNQREGIGSTIISHYA